MEATSDRNSIIALDVFDESSSNPEPAAFPHTYDDAMSTHAVSMIALVDTMMPPELEQLASRGLPERIIIRGLHTSMFDQGKSLWQSFCEV